MSGEYIPAGLASGEEALLERQQDALNELAHLVEDCDNRLSLETLDLAKGYIEGRINLHLELRSWDGRCNFHIVLGRARRQNGLGNEGSLIGRQLSAGLIVEFCNEVPGRLPCVEAQNDLGIVADRFNEPRRFGFIPLREIAVHIQSDVSSGSGADRQDHSAICTNSSHVGNCLHIDRHQTGMMFVRVVKGVECVEQLVSGSVGLQGLNHSVGITRQLCLLSKAGLKFIPVTSEWKSHTSRGRVVLERDGAEHLVERTAEVVQDCPNGHVERGGNFGERIPPDLDSIRVDIGNRFLQARWVGHGRRSGPISGKWFGCENVELRRGLEKAVDPPLEIVDFGFGPFDLGETLQKRRLRFHDIESVMAKTDATKDPNFQKVVQVFLNTPHQPHKPKAKRLRKKRVASAKQKNAP